MCDILESRVTSDRRTTSVSTTVDKGEEAVPLKWFPCFVKMRWHAATRTRIPCSLATLPSLRVGRPTDYRAAIEDHEAAALGPIHEIDPPVAVGDHYVINELLATWAPIKEIRLSFSPVRGLSSELEAS